MSKIAETWKILTPDRVKKEVNSIKKVKFSSNIEKWMKRYRSTGERDDFVLQWCYKINHDWTLMKIIDQHETSLIEVKTLFNMFIILIDDISEKKSKKELLDELIKIPFYSKYIESNHLNEKDKLYLNFTLEVWQEIDKTVKSFPNYKKAKSLFEFDVLQLLSAFRFGYFITEDLHRMNEYEYWTHIPNSMQIIINSDMDLMCNNTFDLEETGKFREIIFTAQKMARIGNWLTTWEREMRENDYTSIVFPYAIAKEIVSFKEIEAKKDEAIKKIIKTRTEGYFLNKWEIFYKKMKTECKKLKSIDGQRIIDKFEYLIFMHLISKGLK